MSARSGDFGTVQGRGEARAFRRAPPRPTITPAEVLAELERIQTENSQPHASGWTHDAGAVVAGDPKLASRIAELLIAPTGTYLMRDVGISLLCTDGSEHGQAALRQVLSDPGVQADPMYAILLLGISSMRRPAEATVALVESLRSSAQVRVRNSATTVLGGQIWALSVSGRVPLADSLAAALTGALKASRDPAEQANLIEALAQGNRPQTRATVRGYARAKEPQASLDCLAGPRNTFVDCIAGSGCTADALNTCFDAYGDATGDCPAPPPAVENGIAIECNGVTPFMCGSGEQVPEKFKCDFKADCMDGSDEVGCPVFMCKDGAKIPLDAECDGFADCRDMSDEQGCPIFMCMSGEEIPEKQKCDGNPDCMDQSDEVGCPVFMCMNGEQIPEAWKCDDFPDCADLSDEANCP